MSENINDDDEFFDCNAELVSKYFSVAVPQDSPKAGVFHTINDANKFLKSVKGSRLKIFSTLNEATKYCDSPISKTEEVSKLNTPGDVCQFSNVKQVDLSKFRIHITNNNAAVVRTLINENPLHLITSYDTPTILQLRFRYNALHVAAIAGHADMVQIILSFLESDEYWEKIFPLNNNQSNDNNERRERVLDLYLNSPEIGCMCRPLHLASKFGHVECVRVLMSHPQTVLDYRDSNGQTAADLSCCRLNESDKEFETKKQTILRSLDQRFVVIVDRILSDDINSYPTVLPPLSPSQLRGILVATNSLNYPGIQEFWPLFASKLDEPMPSTFKNATETPSKDSMKSTPNNLAFSPCQQFSPNPILPLSKGLSNLNLYNYGANGTLSCVRAIMGPFSTNEATKVSEMLAKPTDPFWSEVRLLDSDKGYERYGRFLSVQLRTQWTEYWDFLQDFADFNSHSGLEKLDVYLSQYYNDLAEQPIIETDLNNELTSAINMFDESDVNFCGKKVFTQLSLSPEHRPNPTLSFSTPIKRVNKLNRGALQQNDTNNTFELNCKWQLYRDFNGPTHVLPDSLESSSSSPNSSVDNSFIESSPKNNFNDFLRVDFSPIIGLLNNFIISTPLRWVFADSCVNKSGLVSSPPKRKSLFTLEENGNSRMHHKSLLFKKNLSTPRSIRDKNRLLFRRKHRGKIWPSLITKTKISPIDRRFLTPMEINVRRFFLKEKTKDIPEDKDMYNQYPFIAKWKKEIDEYFYPY